MRKPFTANAEEIASVAEAARHSGLVVMDAFQYRYHALAGRMLEILNSGELGSIVKMEAWLCFPVVAANNVQWNYQLAGGALRTPPVNIPLREAQASSAPRGEVQEKNTSRTGPPPLRRAQTKVE